MSCMNKWAHQALDRLFTGELEGKDFDQLQSHVKTCPSCNEQYERITRAQAKLDRAEVLPVERLSLLENRLMARVDASEKKAAAARAPKVRWWMPALSFGLAAAVAMFVFVTPNKDEFRSKGSGSQTAFGLRAFCVDSGANGKVLAEALPGQKLKCPQGSTLQLTYTAPKPAKLKVEVKGQGGSLEPMFPQGGGLADVAQGVDVPMGFSTPVNAQWLAAPVSVVATFADDASKEITQSAITIEP